MQNSENGTLNVKMDYVYAKWVYDALIEQWKFVNLFVSPTKCRFLCLEKKSHLFINILAIRTDGETEPQQYLFKKDEDLLILSKDGTYELSTSYNNNVSPSSSMVSLHKHKQVST